jgi:hypothetical protein
MGVPDTYRNTATTPLAKARIVLHGADNTSEFVFWNCCVVDEFTGRDATRDFAWT